MCDDEPQHESLLDFGQLVDFSETRKAQKGSKFFVYLLMLALLSSRRIVASISRHFIVGVGFGAAFYNDYFSLD